MRPPPQVSVFVGGTSGIGKYTIRALVATGASMRIYLVGRKSSEAPTQTFIRELHALNPQAEVIWTEAEVSLLAETARVCDLILAREARVDLLFLTAGYAPFGARRETAEGIEIVQSLEFYSRVLFVVRLLPLLRAAGAGAGRVVSVLAGGLEKATINLEDLDLRQDGSFSGYRAQVQYGAMGTTTWEKLAGENPDVTFIHSWPGVVNTGNVRRGRDPNSLVAWLVWLFVEPVLGLLAMSEEECGQRHLFQSTSAAFGGRGVSWKSKAGVNSLGEQEDGLFLVNYKCEWTPNAKAVSVLRERAQAKVWDHTQEVLRPYL